MDSIISDFVNNVRKWLVRFKVKEKIRGAGLVALATPHINPFGLASSSFRRTKGYTSIHVSLARTYTPAPPARPICFLISITVFRTLLRSLYLDTLISPFFRRIAFVSINRYL